MKDINKILIFLTFALIYSSVIYLISQRVEVDIEVSNALINDMVLNQKYTDGTYASGWHWQYTDDNGKMTNLRYVYQNNENCANMNVTRSCSPHILLSNQTLNGTTHLKISAPFSIVSMLK